jgi:hypothetical protein
MYIVALFCCVLSCKFAIPVLDLIPKPYQRTQTYPLYASLGVLFIQIWSTIPTPRRYGTTLFILRQLLGIVMNQSMITYQSIIYNSILPILCLPSRKVCLSTQSPLRIILETTFSWLHFLRNKRRKLLIH